MKMILIVCFLAFLMGACSYDNSDLKKYIDRLNNSPEKSGTSVLHFDTVTDIKWSKASQAPSATENQVSSDISHPSSAPKGSFSPCLGRRERGRAYLEEILKRNLFTLRQVSTKINLSDKKRKKQALEAFSLNTLRFVGTIKGKTLFALIRQPDKQIVRVKRGDYIGKNEGRILLIEENKITVKETIRKSQRISKQIRILNLNTVSLVDAGQ